jgi:predicted ATP-grasp superfamily ATP-dependent carboligase
MFGDAWRMAAPAQSLPSAREPLAFVPRTADAGGRPAPLSPALDTSRPVLIFDGGSRADLGLVRSLGFAGIRVHLLTSGPASVTAQSRYVTQTHAFPHSSASDAERVARIRAVAKSLSARPVLLASGDRTVRFLSRCRDQFADVVDHDLPDERTVNNCLDKSRFARVAARLSLPVPQTWIPRNLAAMQTLAPRLEYPVFVKPIHGDAAASLPHEIRRTGKGWQVKSAAELLASYRLFAQHGMTKLVIQEYVPGPDSELASVHMYVDASGRMVGSFTGMKARAWPPDAGVATAVTSRRNERLVTAAADIMRKMRYSGFAILQFKRDPRHDEYRLIEINCRYGTWTELPSRCGCNFPVAAYAAITKQPIPPIVQREGASWLDFSRDFSALTSYRRTGAWTWATYLRSLSSVRCWAFFALDDPAPFFWQLLRRQAK